jgi:hypothetical protein
MIVYRIEAAGREKKARKEKAYTEVAENAEFTEKRNPRLRHPPTAGLGQPDEEEKKCKSVRVEECKSARVNAGWGTDRWETRRVV